MYKCFMNILKACSKRSKKNPDIVERLNKKQSVTRRTETEMWKALA